MLIQRRVLAFLFFLVLSPVRPDGGSWLFDRQPVSPPVPPPGMPQPTHVCGSCELVFPDVQNDVQLDSTTEIHVRLMDAVSRETCHDCTATIQLRLKDTTLKVLEVDPIAGANAGAGSNVGSHSVGSQTTNVTPLAVTSVNGVATFSGLRFIHTGMYAYFAEGELNGIVRNATSKTFTVTDLKQMTAKAILARQRLYMDSFLSEFTFVVKDISMATHIAASLAGAHSLLSVDQMRAALEDNKVLRQAMEASLFSVRQDRTALEASPTRAQTAEFTSKIAKLAKVAIQHNYPGLVIIFGAEKVGKSTLINNIIGMHIAYSHGDVATLCAVFYQLRRGPERITFNGKVIALEEVFAETKAFMQKIPKDQPDVKNHLVIEIQGDYLVEMDIVDTPGITDNTVAGGSMLSKTMEIIDQLSQRPFAVKLHVMSAVDWMRSSASAKLLEKYPDAINVYNRASLFLLARQSKPLSAKIDDLKTAIRNIAQYGGSAPRWVEALPDDGSVQKTSKAYAKAVSDFQQNSDASLKRDFEALGMSTELKASMGPIGFGALMMELKQIIVQNGLAYLQKVSDDFQKQEEIMQHNADDLYIKPDEDGELDRLKEMCRAFAVSASDLVYRRSRNHYSVSNEEMFEHSVAERYPVERKFCHARNIPEFPRTRGSLTDDDLLRIHNFYIPTLFHEWVTRRSLDSAVFTRIFYDSRAIICDQVRYAPPSLEEVQRKVVSDPFSQLDLMNIHSTIVVLMSEHQAIDYKRFIRWVAERLACASRDMFRAALFRVSADSQFAELLQSTELQRALERTIWAQVNAWVAQSVEHLTAIWIDCIFGKVDFVHAWSQKEIVLANFPWIEESAFDTHYVDPVIVFDTLTKREMRSNQKVVHTVQDRLHAVRDQSVALFAAQLMDFLRMLKVHIQRFWISKFEDPTLIREWLVKGIANFSNGKQMVDVYHIGEVKALQAELLNSTEGMQETLSHAKAEIKDAVGLIRRYAALFDLFKQDATI